MNLRGYSEKYEEIVRLNSLTKDIAAEKENAAFTKNNYRTARSKQRVINNGVNNSLLLINLSVYILMVV